jgi:hypothetical protein
MLLFVGRTLKETHARRFTLPRRVPPFRVHRHCGRSPSAITRQVQRLEAAVEGTASATCPDLTGSSDESRKDTKRLPSVDQELRDLILEDLAVDIGARRVKGPKIPVIPGGDANSRRRLPSLRSGQCDPGSAMFPLLMIRSGSLAAETHWPPS